MSTCLFCGKEAEVRLGCCFDCANAGEERAAKRTVIEHLRKALRNLRRRNFYFLKCDLRWAWERFSRTGDYERGGYFDQEGIDWRQKR